MHLCGVLRAEFVVDHFHGHPLESFDWSCPLRDVYSWVYRFAKMILRARDQCVETGLVSKGMVAYRMILTALPASGRVVLLVDTSGVSATGTLFGHCHSASSRLAYGSTMLEDSTEQIYSQTVSPFSAAPSRNSEMCLLPARTVEDLGTLKPPSTLRTNSVPSDFIRICIHSVADK